MPEGEDQQDRSGGGDNFAEPQVPGRADVGGGGGGGQGEYQVGQHRPADAPGDLRGDEHRGGARVQAGLRRADQHRVFSEFGFSEPDATAEAKARWETVWLGYADERGDFASLTRQKGTELWEVTFSGGRNDVCLSGNGVGYEQGIALIAQALGGQMPKEFNVTRS